MSLILKMKHSTPERNLQSARNRLCSGLLKCSRSRSITVMRYYLDLLLRNQGMIYAKRLKQKA